ncbi:hypothetical protein Q9R20_03415 [Microbacterium sp. PRF11]|uniref:hypothetical protein n=1 Tax=Microbacterium sp. PRF11 TaxID=2962593 RepID=UPI0028814A74|nr:hypothetical protein [Microbacterium sp. PRF11]MDT0116029.1 hypothetical protein [Microbacterium sp. PRF11]
MRTRTSLPVVTALTLAIVSGAAPASATAAPELSASPATLSIGHTTTLAADDAAAASTPTDEATPEVEPDPEAEAGRFAFVLIPLIAAAIVVVGGIFVITRGRRRPRGD